MRDADVIIVSGLPRSGTSMMMQMLEAGGVEILSDGERRADDDNPRGYYELEAVKKTRDDASWLEQAAGRAVKMISQLLLDLPQDGHTYRILFMRREMEEILASQRRMLERRGGGASAGFEDSQMSGIFADHLTQVQSWLTGRPDIQVQEVWYGDVISDATGTARKVKDFVGRDLDEMAMSQVVEGALHRNQHRRPQSDGAAS